MDSLKKIQDFIILAIVLIGVVVVGYIIDPKNFLLVGVNPHPFVVIGVLFAAAYGIKKTLISSLIIVSLFFVLLHLQVDYQEVESLLEIHFLTTPLTVIFLSLLVGELKQRSLDRVSKGFERIGEMNSLIDSLKMDNGLQKSELEELKLRLVSKVDTVSKLYKIANDLNVIDKDLLYSNFLTILKQNVGVNSAVLFRVDSDLNEIEKKFFIGSQCEELKKTQNFKKIDDQLLSKVIESGKIETVGDGILNDLDDEKGLQSLIACPIYVNDELYALLGVYEIPFLKYIPSNFRLIDVLCRWLGKSIERSVEFSKISSQSAIDLTYGIWKYDQFVERLKEEFDQAKEYGLPLSIAKLKVNGFQDLDDIKKIPIKKVLADIADTHSRKMDFVGLNKDANSLLVIILDKEKNAVEFCGKVKEEFDGFGLKEGESLELLTGVTTINNKMINPEELWDSIPKL